MGILAFFLLLSCYDGERKRKDTAVKLREELREINWEAVDSYPLFEACDEGLAKDLQLACFKSNFQKYLRRALEEEALPRYDAGTSKIKLTVIVDTSGQVLFESAGRISRTASQRNDIERILSKSLKKLPRLAPALKRGIPVRTKFEIPIYLKSKE